MHGAMQYACVWHKVNRAAFYKGTERFLSGGSGTISVSFQPVADTYVGVLSFDLFLTSGSSSPNIWTKSKGIALVMLDLQSPRVIVV